MKARRVRKLDPDGALADNAQRIIETRLDELCGFVPQVLDPAEVEALHDMRIAAKRLRYLLEVTGFCFGSYAVTATKRAKELQDLLGEIHDCDVLLPQVRAHLDDLRARDATRLASLGSGEDLDPALLRRAPRRGSYRGVASLATYLEARRSYLYDRFLELWRSLEDKNFRSRLEKAVAQRPRAPEPPAPRWGVHPAMLSTGAAPDEEGNLGET